MYICREFKNRNMRKQLETKAKEFDLKLKKHPSSSIELQKVLCDFVETLIAQDDLKEIKNTFMPSRLTAENGAKTLLMGEFFEEIEVLNEKYCGCGECDYCIDFPDIEETSIKKVPVSWSTIKEIYSKIVSYYEDITLNPKTEL